VSRNAALPALVAGWVAGVLGLDTIASLGQQRLLGVVTWLLLLACLRGEQRPVRVQVAVVVAFASLIEYVFAGWLGVYVYRLHNVPAFVPPGHGLVYLAALAIGRSTFASRHTRLVLGAALTACGAWAVWGLVLSPRPDALGAFWFACLVVFSRWGRSRLVYAGAFLVVSYLEVVGTSLGTWAWQPHDPTGLISIGNPPSGIAGGYAWFDAAALLLTPRLLARWDARGGRVSQGASSGTSSTGRVRASTTTAVSTSAAPPSCTGDSVSPNASPATPTLTTGSNVLITAVSDGPSSASAPKNALTATTVPINATPSRASQDPEVWGSEARVDSASTS